MKKNNHNLHILFILIMMLSCSSKKAASENFVLNSWLENPHNAMQLLFVSVCSYKNPFDIEPITYIEANEEQKKYILDLLMDFIFQPVNPDQFIRPAIVFGMNSPFMFFSFSDKGLVAKWLPDGSNDYHYNIALFEDYPQLWDLSKFTGEMILPDN
jgi:hypothetical protein